MALDALVTSLDNIPESLHGEYRQLEDGTYLLDVRPSDRGYSLENTQGLKKALQSERQRASAFENENKKLAAYKDIDIHEAQAALARVKELEGIDPVKEAEKIAEAKVKSNLEAISKKYNEQLSEKDSKLSAREAQLQKLLLKQAVDQALAKHQVTGAQLVLAQPHVLQYLRLAEVNGEFVAQVVDDHGNPRISNFNADPMNVEELVDWMKGTEVYSPLFPATNKSGSGTLPNKGQAVSGNVRKSQMSLSEKTDYIQKHGQVAYLKLPE